MVKKTVIIINGKGGSGKYTFFDIVADYCNVSAISAVDTAKNDK